MSDTTPEIADRVRKRLLERSGAERVAMGSRMFNAARAMALASLPTNLSDVEIRIRLCERLYGAEVDQAGFAAHLRAIADSRS
ncbi:MAG: hypothetical protein ACKV2V_24950 [Blastocatellia bacterium]